MNIGFKEKSFFDRVQHYEYGDDNWEVAVRGYSPTTARYNNIYAQSFFGDHPHHGFKDARLWADHPGTIAIFARLHVVLVRQGRLKEGMRLSFNSSEVHDLIGGFNDQV